MSHGSASADGLARRSVGRRLHAPPLAEKAACRSRRMSPGAARHRSHPALRTRSARRRRVASRRSRRRALVGAARADRTTRVADTRDAGLDAAGPGRRSARRAGAPAAAALSLHRRRPPRRRDVLVRERRRRRRPARRLVRRLPAADVGVQALAHRPCRQAAPARRCAAQDARRLRGERGMAARAGRHAVPAAGLGPRRRRGRRLHHRIDRLSRSARGRTRRGCLAAARRSVAR